MREFKKGDRVRRPALFETETVKRGTVVDVYPSTKNGQGQHDTLYAVHWDTGTVERGYLGNGLEPEPLSFPSFQRVD